MTTYAILLSRHYDSARDRRLGAGALSYELGVLPGILRSRLVSQAHAVERILFPEDLVRADALYVGNSARGLLQAELVQDV